MSDDEKFDVAIIGAGPAGAACAYRLAKAGKQVLLLERGDTPGAKNLAGGRFYTYALEMLDLGLNAQAALERPVTHEQIMLLSADRALVIDYRDPVQALTSSTILRAHFDEWLAGRAEAAGAVLACGIRVDGVIERQGRIVGVRAGEDEIFADMVVAADGVNSLTAQSAGLIPQIPAHTVGVGLKEVIALPAETIEARFNLAPGRGAARVILGGTNGIHGGGFVYTNRQSVSLGCVLCPGQAAERKKPVHAVLQQLKCHPAIQALIQGGQTVEYGAHLVSEAGWRQVPATLDREGLLLAGDAAGFVINAGYTIRGVDLAILSGIAAAEAIVAATRDSEAGPLYREALERIGLLATMKAADPTFDVLDTTWLYDKAPDTAADVCAGLFAAGGHAPRRLRQIVAAAVKRNGLSWWQILKFAAKGIRSL